ncbi:hypothetical protein JXM67_15545, partial [candidate division WOR-3 bacterium]|nr:hypothetical protein [candidate division WOR-3 bacterium]
MKRKLVLAVSILLSVTAINSATAETAGTSEIVASDYLDKNTTSPDISAQPVEESNYVGKIRLPFALQERDTFATFVYTYGDIVVFSYADDNPIEILDSLGNLVTVDTLMLDEYLYAKDIPWGVYQVLAEKEFSVLSGDPWGVGLGCWYAVDQHSSPISTKLLSVGPKTAPSGYDACMLVFAYHDNTHVIVRNLDNDQVIFEGDLDSADYWIQNHGDIPPVFYSVEASYPVSTMTACGVNGMYIPSFNGTFTGTDFMGYQHGWSGTPQDCQVIPWEDNTRVTMHSLTNPSMQYRSEVCQNKGDVTLFSLPVGEAVYIHSDKPISVSQTEWWSFGMDKQFICAFYMVRGIDPDGLGLGREFYIPIEVTYSDSPSRLHVIAFTDDTYVRVTRSLKSNPGEAFLWEGNLDRGDFYRYTNGGEPTVFHIVADKGVATIGSCKDRQGSDFMPLWFAIHPAVAVLPDQFKQTECTVTCPYDVTIENNGNAWDVINMDTMNTKCSEFATELSDFLGQTLPDVDGNGEPDTDTLVQGGAFEVLAEVTPVDKLPFGYTDTCYLSIVSARDPARLDTAILVTTIREIAVSVDSNTTL